ncbi:hypothetical protein Fmac_014868 [Flemingia macrophylla]|uniref:Uncharacterized protein n=1 Tax=Flemingia macrophylla TaxID=520843 RepID=A0ABD1MCX8_9FABA
MQQRFPVSMEDHAMNCLSHSKCFFCHYWLAIHYVKPSIYNEHHEVGLRFV